MAFRDFWRRAPHRDERRQTRFPLDPLSRESWREDSEARFGDRHQHDYSADDESRRFNHRWQNSYSGPGFGTSRTGDRDHRESYGGSRDNPFYGDRPLAHAGEVYDSDYFGAGNLPKTPWQPDATHSEQREWASGTPSWYESESWQSPTRDRALSARGQFRGVGPRGYRRSDERIKEDVCQCLTDDRHIDASNVEVTVKDREVVLSGTVQSRAEKRHAEDLIERLSGVRDVINSLRVASPETSQTSSQSTSPSSVAPERHSGNWR